MREINIAIAGLGTVGQGVFNIIKNNQELLSKRTNHKINIVAVSARDKKKDRGLDLKDVEWFDDPIELAAADNIDIIIELIGGSEGVAKNLCVRTLESGKQLVTANKALIAEFGYELAQIAESHNSALMFDAAVVGGVPIIKTLKEGVIANNISKVQGILNGTCNYILTAMTNEGRAFDDVLKEAQELGYAEADPSFDVEGKDAAHKLAIMSSIAFGIKPAFDEIYTEGITQISPVDIKYADKLGYKIRLIGSSQQFEDGSIEQRVTPCMIKSDSDLANVSAATGAVRLECDSLGPLFLKGAGAGMYETASSVVADICDIACGRFTNSFGVSADQLEDGKFSDIKDHRGDYYLRFTVEDTNGVLSSITNILSNNKVGFEKVHQEPSEDKENIADIVIITHDENEHDIRSSLKEIGKQNYIIESPIMIRVE
jgi:homoserine dehydrogenase